MAEGTELVVQELGEASGAEGKELSTVVANSPGELQNFGPNLQNWARKKLDSARVEWEELQASADLAKKRKWNPAPLRNAAKNALSRVEFYDKVVAALEAGYILFPPVPNADVIAIRTGEGNTASWQTTRPYYPPQHEEPSEALPRGEGDYRNPTVKWRLMRVHQHPLGEGKGTEERKEWRPLDLDDPTFPLVMAKPEIIEATSAAMELKVFDEIRLFPLTKRKGDPCILGSIIEKSKDRRLYFLISWRIDERDL